MKDCYLCNIGKGICERCHKLYIETEKSVEVKGDFLNIGNRRISSSEDEISFKAILDDITEPILFINEWRNNGCILCGKLKGVQKSQTYAHTDCWRDAAEAFGEEELRRLIFQAIP